MLSGKFNLEEPACGNKGDGSESTPLPFQQAKVLRNGYRFNRLL